MADALDEAELADLLAQHLYQGSYRMWCTCGEVEPLPYRYQDIPGYVRPNVAQLHREHLALLIAEACTISRAACQEAQARAWDEGYLRGVFDQESELERADNPYVDDGASHA